MGSIVKRGDKYQIKQRSPTTGRWWSATAPSLADARRVRAEMESAASRGDEWVHPRARRPADPRLRVAAEAFLVAEARRLSPLTVRRYGGELERFVTWAERDGRGHLRHLGRALAQAYVVHLQTTRTVGRRPRSAAAIAKSLDAVNAWWRWLAEHDDEHGLGPVDQPRRVQLTASHRQVTSAPSWEGMDSMIALLPSGWAQRLALLQRFLGVRMSEGLALRWVDFDLASAQLVVRAEICKGRRGGRIVPVSPHLIAMMRVWPKLGELVCGEGADAHRHRSDAARIYSRAWTAAKVPQVFWALPTHALRKGFVSGLLSVGARPDAVEYLVGHTLGEVRARYIDPFLALDLRAQVALIPQMHVAPRSLGVPCGL